MLLEASQAAQDYLNSPPGLADQITAAAASAWVIQRLKCWPQFPWIDQNSEKINRIVSGAFALVTTLGIHAVWERTPEHGGVFILSGIPTWQEALPMIWKASGSFIMQELIYRNAIKHEPGQQAADVVADTIVAHKKEIAAVVERAEDRHDILKLREPRVTTEDRWPEPPKPKAKDEWGWLP